jgi:hypothetical protein
MHLAFRRRVCCPGVFIYRYLSRDRKPKARLADIRESCSHRGLSLSLDRSILCEPQDTSQRFEPRTRMSLTASMILYPLGFYSLGHNDGRLSDGGIGVS